MTNNSMAISLSQNTHSSYSDYATPNLGTNNSSLKCNSLPQPTTIANQQPCQNLPLVILPTKKPRGRPPASKNKHSLGLNSLLVAPHPTKHSLVLVNVGSGRDIMESILDVARQRCVNVTVLNASGTIANITLISDSHNIGATTLTLNGPFNLLSMNGTYLYNHQHQHPPLSFSVNLSTSQGHLLGGIIGGKVIASDNVYIVLCTYLNVQFYNCVPEAKECYDDNKDNNTICNNNPSDFNVGGDLFGFDMFSAENFGW